MSILIFYHCVPNYQILRGVRGGISLGFFPNWMPVPSHGMSPSKSRSTSSDSKCGKLNSNLWTVSIAGLLLYISRFLANKAPLMSEIWHRVRFSFWHSTYSTFSSSKVCISCLFCWTDFELIKWGQGYQYFDPISLTSVGQKEYCHVTVCQK